MKKKISRIFEIIYKGSIRVRIYGLFYLCYPILRFIPIKKNKIVIDNYWGKGYGDNAKYICNYLLSTDKKLDIVWLYEPQYVSSPENDFPMGIRYVKNRTFKSLFEMYTARIWIDNVRKNFSINKRKGQYYIQTWHAGFSLKNIERNVADKLPPRYVKRAIKDSEMCDLLIFESSDMIEDVPYTFWYEGPLYRKGIPRNDIIINPKPEVIDKVYSTYNISKAKKIVMYAPTFRQNYDLKIDSQFLKNVVSFLSEKFDEEYVMLVRLHPNDTKSKESIFQDTSFGNTIIDDSSYNDMQELLCATDTLITDYSSTIGEMMVSEKKCFIYAYDYDQYMKDRGLLMDLSDLPFPISKNESELKKQINDFDNDEYLKTVRRFKKQHNVFESGHASEDIGNIILEQIES